MREGELGCVCVCRTGEAGPFSFFSHALWFEGHSENLWEGAALSWSLVCLPPCSEGWTFAACPQSLPCASQTATLSLPPFWLVAVFSCSPDTLSHPAPPFPFLKGPGYLVHIMLTPGEHLGLLCPNIRFVVGFFCLLSANSVPWKAVMLIGLSTYLESD